MKSRLTLLIPVVIILIIGTFSSFAADVDITLIPQFNGDCATTIQPRFNFYVEGQDVDITAPDKDIFSLVLFDGDNRPIGYKSASVTVGLDATVSNWSFGDFTVVTQPLSRPFTVRVYDVTAHPADITAAMSGPLLDEIEFDPAAIGACTTLPLNIGSKSASTGQSASKPPTRHPNFDDGRINNWDTGSPVAVYGHDFETGRGLVIYSAEGTLLLQVTPEQIAAVAECPDENTVIASETSVALYRLSSCEFQVNAPSLDGAKTYVLIFNTLDEYPGYSSHEE